MQYYHSIDQVNLCQHQRLLVQKQRRFNENYLRTLEESRKEKIRNATTGLAGLLGGMPYRMKEEKFLIDQLTTTNANLVDQIGRHANSY